MIDTYDAFKKYLLKNHQTKAKLLLHACCAPCASSVLELLQSHFDISIHFYNPNIYPQAEYIKRKNEFKKLGNFPIIEAEYETDEFYQAIKGLEDLGERSQRCWECYKLRLLKTAKLAKEKGFDYFTTTLSLSPYKDSKKINEIGQVLAKELDIKFLYSDFKKADGYKRSIELSKELDIYRQDYCGCLYSYNERKNNF